MLKKENYKKNIFVFFFIMTEARAASEDILENMAVYDAIEHTIGEEFPHLGLFLIG